MTIKEKADGLINKSSTIILNDEHVAILVAIKSVEHTIEVLNSAFEEQEGTTDIYPVAHAIMEQTKLLTELKSRL